MDSLRLRYAIIGAVTLVAVLYVLPSFSLFRDSALKSVLPDNQVSLGLDLKGGIHLTLGVDTDKAIASALANTGQGIRDEAQSRKDSPIPMARPVVVDGTKLEIVLGNPDTKPAFEDMMKRYTILKLDSQSTTEDGRPKYVYRYAPEYLKRLADDTVDGAVRKITNRIDKFGVSEPDIRKQGGGRIQVQLPGMDDAQRAIDQVKTVAMLEFKIVDESIDATKMSKGQLPPGREIAMAVSGPPHARVEHPMVLKSETVLTGDHIADARVSFDNSNNSSISLAFNPTGARIFERVTGENVGKPMAILLDGKVISAPVIREKIAGGKASISGRYTTQEAGDLANMLREGALPAPITVLEQRSVGPSLGQESIDKGVTSALVGTAVMAAFMVVYYGLSGITAVVALGLNIVLILAGLAMFGATLTMPGIAGIILTLSMAVDANVIIYERIREELRRGLSTSKSLVEGFGRASLTIVDANVTTVIAALVLYEFGTGPIRGFAVTLILGIVASMFTSIFVTRTLLMSGVAGSQDSKLSI